ncbi:MAG: DUF4124 domain-containing protein [Variovorax sp.]|nr:MAG: DUF4124 domain-containing protein [Variovorax sp.]
MACALLILPAVSAFAQPTVYRCETNRKVAYSDEPCIGAKVIDATPTQGMDKMTGRTSKGKEVRRDELNRMFDGAVRPITGKSTEEMNVLRRRVHLPGKDQAQCGSLDDRLARLEAAAPTAAARDKAKADFDLYQARKQFFDLRC